MSASVWRPRTLILQHEAATPPGHMNAWLAEQSAQVEVLRIDEVEPQARPTDFDLIVSLGSEFAAFDDSIPFVRREVKFFEDAIESGVPILGLCFGGQLLARVLGSGTGPWFQWHFDVFTAPPGARLIAESDLCAQAYVAGRSLGLQFHPEVTPEIMDEWVSVYPHELEAEGVDPSGLLEETRRRAAESRAATWRLLDRFRDEVATAHQR